MTHQELIDELGRRLGKTPPEVTGLLEATVREVTDKLSAGNPISIPHIGTLTTLKRAEHILVDASTKERHLIPPSIVPHFDAKLATGEEGLTQLTAWLSERTAISSGEAENFLSQLFGLVKDRVVNGGRVEIEKLGVFQTSPALVGENEQPTPLFFPANELKESVNKPFAHFEAIRLNDGVVLEGIEEVMEEPAPAPEMMVTEEVEPNPESFPTGTTLRKRSAGPVWIPILGGMAIALAALFFFVRWQEPKPPVTPPHAEPVNVEVSHPQPPVAETMPLPSDAGIAPVPPPLQVVVLPGKTLRLIAEEQYGSREFWIYIYLKNRDKIENPNVVAVGTPLIIPDPSEYGIDASDTLSIAKAKALGKRFL